MNVENFKQEEFSFVYITTKSCNVCKVLQPKLRDLAKNFTKAKFHLIELDDHPEAAGLFMAFSIPTFIVYSEGRELIRTARHININEVENKLKKYYNLMFKE